MSNQKESVSELIQEIINQVNYLSRNSTVRKSISLKNKVNKMKDCLNYLQENELSAYEQTWIQSLANEVNNNPIPFGTSATVSIGEVFIDDKKHQVQLRLERDQKEFIDSGDIVYSKGLNMN